ncbi:ATP-dependent DNA helicase DinG [mine drainage metagenome]|uniref:ATP-dependent DNA helicase DinG n=1 Tax=mine drainage metagenome TaxID=410659 RepID=A0A1J5S7J3_9ZZZZ
MHFDLDKRSLHLSAGEFSEFTLGPRERGEGSSGLWRAQLGTHWHRELRARAAQEDPGAEFEVQVSGAIFHRGWTFNLNGRIDQRRHAEGRATVREIKTVLRTLPADESELRAEFPAYFLQLACYVALLRIASPETPLNGELLFVEADSGLSQRVALQMSDDAAFRAQLERIATFLAQRASARERLRGLRIRPAFSTYRQGQDAALGDLDRALSTRPAPVLFEAPTGFGKTGILLEAALRRLREGTLERLVYLTSKSTGQLQVVSTLRTMTAPSTDEPDAAAPPPSIWVVRPKSEHCINDRFVCQRDACTYLRDGVRRWEKSGAVRLILDPSLPRDLGAIRAVGAEGRVCPYEITRAALPCADIWIGDFNYVFSPAVRPLFFEQPGFDPARTLLVVDEAHNLPSRAADAYSYRFDGRAQEALAGALQFQRTAQALARSLGQWAHFVRHLPHSHGLRLADEEDARHFASEAARLIPITPIDYEQLGTDLADELGRLAAFADSLTTESRLPRLWWSPSEGQLAVTCLDAAAAIGSTLREFGAVILASATVGSPAEFGTALGLDTFEQHAEPIAAQSAPPPAVGDRLGSLTKRATRKLYGRITSGAELLRVEEAREASTATLVRAPAPWREGAYQVAVDLRVDTSFQHRERHLETTARSLVDWQAAAPRSGALAVFFPSYAYADSILGVLKSAGAGINVALQPRQSELSAQAAWIEQALTEADALFLVLGSSFAEGIDVLGGRVTRAVVVGPALPEVNPVQHAKMAELASLGRDTAFRRVYQAPGMQKVNQALGRLVRAPGQHAKILLHCRRFAEPDYAALLAPEYRSTVTLPDQDAFTRWLRA